MAVDANIHHREKKNIHDKKGQPKMNFAQGVIHPSAEDLRKPEINERKRSEKDTGRQRVMKMADNKVSIMKVDIESLHGMKKSCQSSDRKDKHNPQRKEHRHLKADGAPPQRAQPVQEKHRCRHADRNGQKHEDFSDKRVHSACEHMMAPNTAA